MSDIPKDIYTEPTNIDPDTLNNLGPLRPMAGSWRGKVGVDINPKAEGPEVNDFTETYENVLMNPQTNGPQLYYGTHYTQTVMNPKEKPVFHFQIGMWLWEPATNTIIQSLSIPRAQVALSVGKADPDATEFEVVAQRDTPLFGICSAPFLDEAFRTLECRCKITIHSEDSWSYEYTSVLVPANTGKKFEHTDQNTLVRVAQPEPNQLMLLPENRK